MCKLPAHPDIIACYGTENYGVSHTVTTNTPSRGGRTVHYAYIIVGVGMLCLIGSLGFGRFAYALLLPTMRDDFATNSTQMGVIATANAFAYMLSAIVCGGLTSRFGARIVIAVALLLCALGLAATALAQNVVMAAAAQFVAGLGTGGAVGPVYSIAGPWFVPGKRGAATGAIQMGSGAGLLIGGFLVPQLLAHGEGWRFVWWMLSALVLVIGVVAALFLRNHPTEKGLTALGLMPEAVSAASPPSSDAPKNLARAVYLSPRIWHLGIIFACFGLSYVVYTVFFADYLMSNGLSKQEAGLVWSLGGGTSVIGSALWGVVADRVGRIFTLRTVLLIQGGGLFILAISTTRPGLYGGALIYGLVLWGMPIVMTLLTAEIVGSRLAAAALGFVIFLFSIGQVCGPLLSGLLKDISGSLVLPLFVAAAIAWTGALLAFAVRLPRKNV